MEALYETFIERLLSLPRLSLSRLRLRSTCVRGALNPGSSVTGVSAL